MIFKYLRNSTKKVINNVDKNVEKCFKVGENIYIFETSLIAINMFVGEYTAKLDNKGRVIFPAPLKRKIPSEEVARGFVIKRDIYEKCLLLYPMKEWDNQTSILKKKLNPFNKQHSSFLREYYRDTAELFFDNSSRLLIPKRLLDEIGAEKELVFAGQEGKIEIWDKAEYERRRLSNEEYVNMANDILGGDFKFYTEE